MLKTLKEFVVKFKINKLMIKSMIFFVFPFFFPPFPLRRSPSFPFFCLFF